MILTQYIVPLFLIFLSGLLLDSHRRAWRAAQVDHQLTDRDRRFARSQYLRRMQASSIIGLIGAALGCYPLVPEEPLAILLYVTALVVACACMMLLALLDVLATRQNLRRLESEQLAQQVKMAMKLRATGKSSDTENRHR
jgi:hypothetical protein